MLTERYDLEFLRKHLKPLAAWRPFPPSDDRAAWEAMLADRLVAERRAYWTEKAEALLGSEWPLLPATLFMDSERTGNRARFEQPYFERRQKVAYLAIAEAMENKGRFVDDIANGLWAISEEATWATPAHCARYAVDQEKVDPLPRQDMEVVDLFACETAQLVADTVFLLREPLMNLSPALCDRMQREVMRRVIAPVETRTDYWWLEGFNNWTPWCSSNTLGAAMHFVEPVPRLAGLAHKLMISVDKFIARYGEDGGCNEGPSYWRVAAGAMLNFLELLYARTDGAVDIYAEPKIRNMGSYLDRMHVHGPYFVNFSDAGAKPGAHRTVVYQYGFRTGVDELKDLALLSAHNWDAGGEEDFRPAGHSLSDWLRELTWFPRHAQVRPLRKQRLAWMPDVQVMVARESERSDEGLVLAAKGGHNGESHNHNDLGQFAIYLDGRPAIIDIGVETYTRKTFSFQRWDIWCIRSSGHNVPLVNGVEQVYGEEHRATNVTYQDDGEQVRLGMNLERAYPENSGIASLRREFTFSGAPAEITVQDTCALKEGSCNVVVPLFSPEKIELLRPGLLAVHCAPRKLCVEYDPQTLQVEITVVPLEDANLRGSWGQSLHKAAFTFAGAGPSGGYALKFLADDGR